MSDEAKVREAIVEVGRRLAAHFFVAANDGNISARLSERELLITPTGVNKGDLGPEMMLKVDPEGNVLSGSLQPTSEMKMHLAVYRRRPDVRAVVHAHPPAATGFAASRIRLDREVVLPEVIFGLGRIGFADYATPTTAEVPQSVEKEIGECEALLLANHGALSVGGDLMQAYYRMETLEMAARILLVTRLLGGPKALDEGQVRDLFGIRDRRGWGRSREAEVSPEVIQVIAQVVLEVLKSRGGPAAPDASGRSEA